MSGILKKVLISGVAALTFGLAVAETSTPAMAFRGGYHGGRGWGWGGLGAGLAVGALAAGAYGYGYGYPYYPYYGFGYGGCWQRRPVYDAYGNFRGYRPVPVC
jgi:hypothetical protein